MAAIAEGRLARRYAQQFVDLATNAVVVHKLPPDERAAVKAQAARICRKLSTEQ